MKAKNRNNQPIRFRFCDTMGLEGNSGLKAMDVAKIIDGHVQDGADVSDGTRDHYYSHYLNPPPPQSFWIPFLPCSSLYIMGGGSI